MIRCFYHLETGVGSYGYLTREAKRETTREAWERAFRPCQHRGQVWSPSRCTAKVLGTESKNGTLFARVSITAEKLDGDSDCSSETWTQTWTQETGRWRMLAQPRVEEAAKAHFRAGNYQAAAEAFGKLWERDPLSMAAYVGLLNSMGNRGASLAGKTIPDLIRGALGVNPRDSRAIAFASSESRDLLVGTMWVDKLKPSDCSYSGAVFNVAANALEQSRPRFALRLMSSHVPSYPDARLALARIAALGALRQKGELRLLLTEQLLSDVNEKLEVSDPSFAAYWARHVAKALMVVGNRRAARELIEAGIRRDPSDTRLHGLLHQLRPEGVDSSKEPRGATR